MSDIGFNSALITGGAGFIGSHLADKLVNEGIETKVLDNFATGRKENFSGCIDKQNFSLFNLDLGKLGNREDYLENVEVVFHMAADPEVRTGYDKPENSFKQNIVNTLSSAAGVAYAESKSLKKISRYKITVLRDIAARLGVRISDVEQTLHAYLSGMKVMDFNFRVTYFLG